MSCPSDSGRGRITFVHAASLALSCPCRTVAELGQLRVLPALGQLRQLALHSSKPLFDATPRGHWLDVTAVFERPTGSASLWVDVFVPPTAMASSAGGAGASRAELLATPDLPVALEQAADNILMLEALLYSERCDVMLGVHAFLSILIYGCFLESSLCCVADQRESLGQEAN